MKDILFSPYLSFYKSPVGAIRTDEEVILTIKITKSFEIYNLLLSVYNDSNEEVFTKPLYYYEDFDNSYNTYQVKFTINKPYIYWYHFSFNDCYGRHYIGRDEELNAKLVDSKVCNFQLNVYEKQNSDFSWYQGKVMYQIYPDRFYVGGKRHLKENGYNHQSFSEDVRYEPYKGVYCNDFYGGNLLGIIEKLPYLKELGVGVIYLNPICLSPTHHHYDTSDYLKIDDVLGTDEDFKKLVKEAKKQGIYIIMDGVYNHTGSDSVYFNKDNHFDSIGAYQSKSSPYYSWYHFNSFPKKYDAWWGIETLPAVNQKSGFVDFITGDDGVISHYMKMGIKGVRLDVVDELDDEFVKKINHQVKKCDKDAITIGEVWEDATNKVAYGVRKSYFDGSELDSVMNYPLKNAIVDFLSHNRLERLVITLREELNNYPEKVLNSLMNVLGTHDTPRIISIFSGVNFNALTKKEMEEISMTKTEYYKCRDLVKMAYMMTYTLPGIPSLYYGDELGMEGGKDPFCRRPMAWETGDMELLNYFKRLGKMRNNLEFYDVLSNGKYREERFENNVFIYQRYNDDVKVIVIINNSDYEYYYPVSKALNLLDNTDVIGGIVVTTKTAVALLVK